MLYHIFLITCCISIIKSEHVDKNNSDIIVSYSGHSELERPVQNKPEPENLTEKPYTQPGIAVTESVVFVPNDKNVFRNGDEVNGLKIEDLIGSKQKDDMYGKMHVTKTEPPNADILFISGKNRDQQPSESRKPSGNSPIPRVRETRRLDCTNLDCNNTINSVCGRREENKRMKFRLFLNKCFFRKVNCGVQNEINRYNLVPIENCKYTGVHFLTRPYAFKPIPLPEPIKQLKSDSRRSFSSRRSLNMGVDGNFCAHSCPISCTEDYDPQCAVSSSGQRKVFLNHCKLDYNSCLYKVVWHRRPLSECVGGRKADITQNRGFIGWMQQAGIIDRRGKLVS